VEDDMAGLDRRDIDDRNGAPPAGFKAHHLKAAASPSLPLRQLALEEPPPDLSGNFKDLESLLDQLGSAPVFELGKPLPNDRYMPRPRVGKCPAAHNRALLDENAD
jgi:hypothetical protein